MLTFRSARRSPLWLFALSGAYRPAYGEKDGAGTLTWLFGIIIGQGAVFAASVKQEGKPVVSVIAYSLIALLTTIGIALILNARDGIRFYHNRLTMHFGRWLQIFSILYAIGFVFASLKGWLPGQTGSRSV